MISYVTRNGNLVYRYDPLLDNYEECEKAALKKHGLVGTRLTTIAVTPATDFLKKEAQYEFN